MTGGLEFLMLLCLLAAQQQEESPTSSTPPPTAPPKGAPPPWPQAVPSGLPPFPGAGWQPDEPPPAAVVTRAYQLLDQLWKSGSGTFKTEQIGGRWITFRAEVVKSGKKGVVAYRLTQPDAAKNYPPQSPAAPPGPADTSPPWGVPAEYRTPAQLPQATSPGSPAYGGGPSSVRTLSYKTPMMTGEDVKLAQQHLHITADGKFGVGTKAAVINFQKTHGLTADGIIGPLTWKPLLLA